MWFRLRTESGSWFHGRCAAKPCFGRVAVKISYQFSHPHKWESFHKPNFAARSYWWSCRARAWPSQTWQFPVPLLTACSGPCLWPWSSRTSESHYSVAPTSLEQFQYNRAWRVCFARWLRTGAAEHVEETLVNLTSVALKSVTVSGPEWNCRLTEEV